MMLWNSLIIMMTDGSHPVRSIQSESMAATQSEAYKVRACR